MAEGRAGALEDYATVAFSMSGVKQDISLEDWKGGWASIVGGLNGKPTSQQFNMVTYILSALLNQAISDLSTVKRTANSAMPKSEFYGEADCVPAGSIRTDERLRCRYG